MERQASEESGEVGGGRVNNGWVIERMCFVDHVAMNELMELSVT